LRDKKTPYPAPQPELEVPLSDNFILQIFPQTFNFFRSQVSTGKFLIVAECRLISLNFVKKINYWLKIMHLPVICDEF